MNLSRQRYQPVVRLSGSWVAYQEAIAWVQTRDASVSKQVRSHEPVDAAYALFTSGVESFPTHDEAENILLDALRHGDVAASGKRGIPVEQSGNNDLELIPDAEWSRLEFRWHGEHIIARSIPGEVNTQIWHSLAFDARDLVAWFPPMGEAVEAREHLPQLLSGPKSADPLATDQPLRPPSMSDARSAFERIVAEWRGAKGQKRRPTRDEVCERIVQELPGITINRVRRLWNELAPREWRVKGPRRLANSAGK